MKAKPNLYAHLRFGHDVFVQTTESSFTELSNRIRAGDSRAEGDLSRRIAPGITQIIVGMTGNFALAQELCQETLIVILTRLRTQPLDDPGKLPAFVAQVARNLVVAERRKSAAAKPTSTAKPSTRSPTIPRGRNRTPSVSLRPWQSVRFWLK